MVHLVLIMMLTVGVSTSACPIMCTCRHYLRDNLQKTSLYYTAVSCIAYTENLTRILENTTKDFQISHLNQQELVNLLNDLVDTEVDFPYLTNLIIIKSEIENLNISAESLERILSLTLTDNHLRSLPKAFLNLSNLQALDLSRNEIKVIELQPFRTLRTLEVLNLSANSLINLYSSSFSGLNVLKCLDLSRNNLSALDDQVLLPLSSLQYLNLSNNRLEVLNEVCFSSLIMLQQLDVSWNRLARVAPGSLHLPSLARLLLAGNPQLGKSREAAVLVGTGRRLQTVDASRTGLKQVPAALTHSIRTLRLAGNSIRRVSCGDVDSYPLLQLLDFTSNALEAIEEDALGRLDSLAILYLTDNNIHEIPKSLPEKLKVLHLEHNNIQRVSSKDLLGLTGLEVLLLSDNKIRVVDEAAFSQLVSLVTLDLSQNPVTILQPGCLSGPSALQVLRLSSIGIISPAEEVSFPLTAPEHLITLDLSDSPGLARQLLADTAALAASRELQELDLSHTSLEFIRSDLLHYLPQLRVLHVKGNNLNCSQLEWLASWMRRQDEPEYRDIICAGPADLWGTPLIDLQDVEISPIQTINQQESSIDSEAINLQRENNTSLYQISSNLTGQYTTESTKHNISLGQENIGNVINNTYLADTVTNCTQNISKGTDSNSSNSLQITNEIEKVSIRRNKVYFANKKNNIIRNNIVGSKKQTQIRNEVITSRQDINFETISTVHLTTIFSAKNAGISVSQGITSEMTTVRSSTGGTHPNVEYTINHPYKEAITKTTPATLNQATEHPHPETPKNANESGITHSNKLDPSRGVSDASQNLFTATEENAFNHSLAVTENYNTPKELKEVISREESIDGDITENSQQWNVSTGETSMYTNNKQNTSFLHPGMLILTVGIMGAAAALAMLTTRFTRKRRNSNLFQQEDIEVSSLPSVTELW